MTTTVTDSKPFLSNSTATRPGQSSPQAADALGRPSNRIIVLMQVLCVTALGISAYLSWVAATASKIFGCGGDLFDCSHVLTSRWSIVLGIPVAVPAMGLYLASLIALFVARRSQSPRTLRLAWSVVTVGALSAGLAAAWFICLQIFLIGHLCPWCLTAHSCGIILGGMLLWMQPAGRAFTPRLAGISAFAIAALIIGQLMTTPPPTYQIEHHPSAIPADDADSDDNLFEAPIDEPESGATFKPLSGAEFSERAHAGIAPIAMLLLLVSIRSSLPGNLGVAMPQERQVRPITAAAQQTPQTQAQGTALQAPRRAVYVPGGIKLDSRNWPILGNPDADFIFVQMFDYTCPHCRAAHTSGIRGAQKYFGDRLAILVLSVPLESTCNPAVTIDDPIHAGACELSRIAVAVWRVQPKAFPQMHEWLMSAARTPREAFAYASRLVGEAEMSTELQKPNAAKYVAKQVELYQKIGGGTVPKILFPETIMTGEVDSVRTLCEAIQRETTLNRPGTP